MKQDTASLRRRIVAQDCVAGGFMWDFHRTLQTQGLPDGEVVMLVQISDRTELNRRWLLISNGVVDLCPEDPRHDVDIHVTAPLAQLIALWMGDRDVRAAAEDLPLHLDGPRHLVQSAPDWFAISPFADVRPATNLP